MKDLLQTWSELEPDRCDLGSDPFYASDDRDYCQVMINGKMSWIGPRNGKVSDGFYPQNIQYAVQQAIEARGWDWKLHSVDYHRGAKRVFYGEVLWYVENTNRMQSTQRSAHDAVTCLLDAYTEALQATKAEEVAG